MDLKLKRSGSATLKWPGENLLFCVLKEIINNLKFINKFTFPERDKKARPPFVLLIIKPIMVLSNIKRLIFDSSKSQIRQSGTKYARMY